VPADSAVRQAIAEKLLDFWTFYKAHAGAARTGLSVRDLLAWVSLVPLSASLSVTALYHCVTFLYHCS